MNFRKLFSLITMSVLILGALAFTPGAYAPAQAQAGAASAVVYNLYATDGYVNMADYDPLAGAPYDKQLYIYGFIGSRSTNSLIWYDYGTNLAVNTGAPAPAPTGGPITNDELALAGRAQLPAPVIYAKVGDVVEIRLKNLGVWANPSAPNDPHSIHLHGLDVDAANDGVPETSVGAVPANMCDNGLTDAVAPYDCIGVEDPGAGIGPSAGFAPGAGNVVVYMFTADTAGTSMYHCHQEADIHVQMGMYGALVIYDTNDPAGNPNSTFCSGGQLNGQLCGEGPGSGTGGIYNGFRYDRDVIMLLSEIDGDYHIAEEGLYPGDFGLASPDNSNFGRSVWNPVDYLPEYWLINGISFPNTIHVNTAAINFSEWVTAYKGYDPLLAGSMSATTNFSNQQYKTRGEKVLLRMINMGFQTQPMHIHGYHLKVLGSDQRPWPWANRVLWGRPTPFNQGMEKNTVLIGSGETYELLIDFGQQDSFSTYADGSGSTPSGYLGGDYPGGTQTRYYDGTAACEADILGAGQPVPAVNTPVSNTFTNCPGSPHAGAPGDPPYVAGPVVTGAVSPLPDGTVGALDPFGAQIFPFHNHDDYKATNNGAYPGGQFTVVIPIP